jgi:hypothetical protein
MRPNFQKTLHNVKLRFEETSPVAIIKIYIVWLWEHDYEK